MSNPSFPLTERFAQALVLAHRLHKGQYRKRSGVPYVAHLLAVASLVLEAGGDEEEAVAALLHDAAEDQGGEPILQEIEEHFGSRVAAIVRSCSDTLESPKPAWEPRKRAHLEHLRSADSSALLVAAADKLHNARDTLESFHSEGPAVWDWFHASREQTLWFYRSIEEMLLAADDERVSELGLRLGGVVDALERASESAEARNRSAGRTASSTADVHAEGASGSLETLTLELDAVLSLLARGNGSEARQALSQLRSGLSEVDLPAELRRRADDDTAVALGILEGSGTHLTARASSRLASLLEILQEELGRRSPS